MTRDRIAVALLSASMFIAISGLAMLFTGKTPPQLLELLSQKTVVTSPKDTNAAKSVVIPKGVTVQNDGEAIIFTKVYNNDLRVRVEVFYAAAFILSQQRMSIGSLFIWRDENNSIKRVSDWRGSEVIRYERDQLTSKQLQWLEGQWAKYANDMNLRELIPHFLKNRPPLPDFTKP